MCTELSDFVYDIFHEVFARGGAFYQGFSVARDEESTIDESSEANIRYDW